MMKKNLNCILTYMGTLRANEPTVLFVPGAMTTPAVFAGLGNYLPCQSAIIDWNNSEGPWEVEEIAGKILRLIQDRQLGETILCGYSMGGVISMSAAIQDTQGLIKGLFIADTGASAKGHGDPNFPDKLQRQWPDKEIFFEFLKRCFARPLAKGMYLQLLDYAMELPRETVVQAARSVRTVDLHDRLYEITCPVLLLHGRFDKSRNREHAMDLAQGIKDLELIWLDCGHTPMVEMWDSYLEKLLYFIEKLHLTKSEDVNVLAQV